MANEPTLTPQQLSEIKTRIQSEAESDRAQLPGDAQLLYDEVVALRAALAARDTHIAQLNIVLDAREQN